VHVLDDLSEIPHIDERPAEWAIAEVVQLAPRLLAPSRIARDTRQNAIDKGHDATPRNNEDNGGWGSLFLPGGAHALRLLGDVKDDGHAPRSAPRAHHAAFQAGEREVPAAGPDERGEIKVGLIDARPDAFHAVTIPVRATDRYAPTMSEGVA
jgi:hypothetical protein